MTGIRRRMSIAFLSIVGLLFASGMISFFELSHLSYDTEEILKANQRNVELAKEMLGAVHDQNVAIVHLAILQDASYDSLCRTGMQRLEHAVATAQKGALDRSALDSLTGATTELLVLTKMFLATESPKAGDESGEVWYNEYYEKQYEKVVTAVRDYMTSTQSSLAQEKRLPGRYSRADIAGGDDRYSVDALLLYDALLCQSDRGDEQGARTVFDFQDTLCRESRV